MRRPRDSAPRHVRTIKTDNDRASTVHLDSSVSFVAPTMSGPDRPRLGPKVPRDRLVTVSNNSDQAYVAPRLTQFAAGGGCACKIPAGLLERLVSGLPVGGGP